ncbi:hypothetical protein HR059_02535 [Sinorhizobium meliloti WSM1022]|jgi:hypothetical protein|uniref:Uncharacterized protein n=2 Tax=Rhizobium meliloti TaxID=382 RepID=F7X961_SINMM|nr:hypothetical protein [Sinorhizobium meliloti]PST29149.1 hypothetical protein C7U62_05600 [Mesorhizobium loti]TWA94214.1 hypothetical protein FB000_12264 [Ensifer sp. SEMIA 134]TWB28209.1 hypothetical protein FB001_12756 [Ensifer sp. SEMIA 135]AEG03307.1 hypothetical protein SinmeB_0363 [Sinorhizobium meliloti BL225C]AEG52221.1 hypothetical protein Sinme_0458 [Sinorhizobium meliloti AK83]
MSTKDTNATPEQSEPADVRQPANRKKHRDEESIAPPAVQPPGAKDTSEKPEVNPVTGGAL